MVRFSICCFVDRLGVGRKTLTNSLSPRSHPSHLLGKRTAQKDTIIDITSDIQVNSDFPYRWSPANLTFNNYFYLFLYLYITRITINNIMPHLKSPKSRIGMASYEITWGGGGGGRFQLVCSRPTLALCSALVLQTLSCSSSISRSQ